jgi:hypothetical protein
MKILSKLNFASPVIDSALRHIIFILKVDIKLINLDLMLL